MLKLKEKLIKIIQNLGWERWHFYNYVQWYRSENDSVAYWERHTDRFKTVSDIKIEIDSDTEPESGTEIEIDIDAEILLNTRQYRTVHRTVIWVGCAHNLLYSILFTIFS